MLLSEVESTTGSSIDGEKAEETEKKDQPVIIVTRPQLDRQQSLLEMPFLKKTLPSSASLVSTNPEGFKPSPLTQTKTPKPSKPNITKIMRLTHLKRAQTSASSLFIQGAASAPSTPEDEGFMMFKETALQSRQRRQEYIRRRSLPITSTETSMNNENNNTDTVKFYIGDDGGNDIRNVSVTSGKHKRTSSFEKFLAAQKLMKYAEIDKNNLKPSDIIEAKAPKILSNTVDQLDEPINIEISSVGLNNAVMSPKKSRAGQKVSDTSRKKSRRASVYHPGPRSPQMHNNWKMLATNFLGTGPIDVRRPSVYVQPSREEQQMDKRRRNRIFSVA